MASIRDRAVNGLLGGATAGKGQPAGGGAAVVPLAPYAIIGGSGTFSLDFPEALEEPGVKVLQEGLVFPTPYGESPPFKLFTARGKKVLTCKMHGRRWGIPRGRASQQVFWVLREAGATRVISEGGVGSINHLLDPRDLVVPHDYIDFSMRRDVSLESGHLMIMRRALCPQLRESLVAAARQEPGCRVFDRGIYVVTDGHHFESPAEISVFRLWGADVVGQSLCPEAYLAREIGACYASLNLVVNYAEGVVRDWEHRELVDIFYSGAPLVGRILLRALEVLDDERNCGCDQWRKPTLLRDRGGTMRGEGSG